MINTVLAPDCRNNEASSIPSSGNCTAGAGSFEPMAGSSSAQEELDSDLEGSELRLGDETQLDDVDRPALNIGSGAGGDESSGENDADDGVDSDSNCGSGHEEDADLSSDELDMEETYGDVDRDEDTFSYN